MLGWKPDKKKIRREGWFGWWVFCCAFYYRCVFGSECTLKEKRRLKETMRNGLEIVGDSRQSLKEAKQNENAKLPPSAYEASLTPQGYKRLCISILAQAGWEVDPRPMPSWFGAHLVATKPDAVIVVCVLRKAEQFGIEVFRMALTTRHKHKGDRLVFVAPDEIDKDLQDKAKNSEQAIFFASHVTLSRL